MRSNSIAFLVSGLVAVSVSTLALDASAQGVVPPPNQQEEQKDTTPPPPVPPPVEERQAPSRTGQAPPTQPQQQQPQQQQPQQQPQQTTPGAVPPPNQGQAPQAGSTTQQAGTGSQAPAVNSAPGASTPSQPLGPKSELPYYFPVEEERLPPPPPPPPAPAAPTLKVSLGPLFRTHYMLNGTDFTYFEIGALVRFGDTGSGISVSYLTDMDGLLVGYETPNFFGIKLYEGVVDVSLSGPKAHLQLGGADVAGGALVANFGGNPLSVMVAGCDFPFYAQLGPQLSGVLVAPPDAPEPDAWGTVGIDLEAGFLFF